MPETDVSKMKVADLKRELKLRGLATSGNKTELQDRLQTALIDGDISLEDTAISCEDALLDDDAVLTDEEEEKSLGADENELLKSPVATPTASEVASPLDGKSAEDVVASTSVSATSSTAPIAPKKIILKRRSSFISNNAGSTAVDGVTATTKENTEPPKEKILKMSERNPITMGETVNKTTANSTSTNNNSDGGKKLTQLSQKERLELRAKKFGLNAANSADNSKEIAPTKIASNITPSASNDPKQIEMLKKRAERFGCVVSSKMAKIDAEEKLLKRKERFGTAEAKNAATTVSNASKGSDIWAEKARARLERFKTTSTVTPATTKISIATGGASSATTSAATTTTNATAVASN